MQDPQQIWEFGRWIARREPATVRLNWSGGELVLGVRGGRIHSAVGLDPGELARRLQVEGAGEDELLAEARSLGELRDIPETKAVGTAKELIQEAIHRWLEDSDRRFEIDDEEPPLADGATISITHAVVELVLADTEHNVAGMILPDHQVDLQRSGGFLELYAPLRLSEEADLIVASITGTATVAGVMRDSSHHPDEVVRLIAALVATGVLEASESVVTTADLDWVGDDLEDTEPVRRQIPVWMIAAAAAVLVIIIAASWIFFGGDDAEQPDAATATGDFGVVVEMGCEPEDLQRMLKKRSQERSSLRTVKADPANGDTCFRLVWGSFTTRNAAEEAVPDVPDGLIEEGFEAHVIEVEDDEAEGALGVEG